MTDESKAARDVAIKKIDDRYDDFIARVNEIPLSRILFRPMFKDPLRAGISMWRTLFIAETTLAFLKFVSQEKVLAEIDLARPSRRPINSDMALAVIAAYNEQITIKRFGAVPFVAKQFNIHPSTVHKIISMRGFRRFEPLHPDIEIAIKASVLPLVYNIIETPQVPVSTTKPNEAGRLEENQVLAEN